MAKHPIGLINPDLYLMLRFHATGLVDVTHGNNTVSFIQGKHNKRYTVTGFPATAGYDLASGVGTVNAPAFVAELGWLADHHHWRLAQLKRVLHQLG